MSRLITLVALFVAVSTVNAQVYRTDHTETFRGAMDYNALSLINREIAISMRLDNELKYVQNRFEKRLANIHGQAAVKTAKMEEQERVLAAKIAHHEAYSVLRQQEQQMRAERQASIRAMSEEQRRQAMVHVDIASRLYWPEVFQDSEFAWARSAMHTALGGDKRFTATGAELELEEVEALADAMFRVIRLRRDEIGDERVIAAKRFLDGLVRSARMVAEPGAAMEHMASR